MLTLESKYGLMPAYHYRNIASAEFAGKILEKIVKSPAYEQIALNLESNKVRFYFLMNIRMQIDPFIYKLVYTIKYGSIKMKKMGVWLPPCGVFLLLREFWPEDIRIKRNVIRDIYYIVHLAIRSRVKNFLYCFLNVWNRYWCKMDGGSTVKATIAVHYAEGLNLNARSDIMWFPRSGIKAHDMLIFLDSRGYGVKRKLKFFLSVSASVIKKIKSFGFRWCVIPSTEILLKKKMGWSCHRGQYPGWFTALKRLQHSGIDKWIIGIADELLNEIFTWRCFFESFNVKILFQPEEYDRISLAQGIAYDLMKENAGITVFKQRSDIPEPAEAMAGFYSKDIVFSWNHRFKEHLSLPYNHVRVQVISGHPDDVNFYSINAELNEVKSDFLKRGVKFTIALFDAGYGDPLKRKFSTEEMATFYKYFLEWLLNDKEVGIVIKSKKPGFLKALRDIQPLLAKAHETGRCYQLENELERLPVDAAKIADFAVGAGISSALIEAVISGCRGVHYSEYFPQYHEYYKWGYEKLVFTDLNRLLFAIKNYKNGSKDYFDLGDWTAYLNLLDPFRDGKSNERMGKYLYCCLEGFNKGLKKDEIIQMVNESYARQWGVDKITNFDS